ncbi:HAD-IC family P-type ATPase, partial [Candidatus Giovannonibacteria bacterium]|nr:HAD-IC family P-type ATPase [Candidatus Giovannonibacteria bacterium]
MNNLSPQLNAVAETFSALRSGAHGLGLVEAKERLKKIGPNVLPETRSVGWFLIFLHQFQSPLIYILLAAGSAIYFIGEVADAAIIGAVLFFNSIAGAFQEGRAQNTLRALKKFSETKATVLREGKEYIISDREIVPGDVIILNEGEKIPADARIIFSGNLKVDEAALTGESEPVHKIAGDELGAGEENKNIIYKGTHVVFGSGRALVFATGVSTKVGKIAKEIAGIDTEIPLKANIRHLSRLVILSVTLISVFLFIFGIFAGHPIKEMFTTIVTLSVSVIPEGLPVVMTLVLATGVWRMSKSNALVKRLQAVEALGQARVLALDKTGTLTKNEMVIEKVFTGNFYNVSGTGYEPKGDVVWDGNIIDPANHEDLLFAGKIAALCANARVVYSEEEKRWNITGDPTEAAMIVFANKLGFHKNELLNESPLLDELPFDYRLKYHATYHKLEPQNILSVVGAPEIILKKSSKILRGGKSYLLTAEEKENLEQIFFSMSKEGLRVVAFAESKEAKVPLSPEKIEDLTFAGFFGMKDALREEAAQAIARAKSAGMKIVIITGDHKATAEAIAREAGIWEDGDKILTGEEIENLSENDLAESITNVSLFARVTPEHKLSIIKAFKKSGDVVAMTGDGVNDAPSLVAADLGVAMGKIGTEVTKEASDIILLDDNF